MKRIGSALLVAALLALGGCGSSSDLPPSEVVEELVERQVPDSRPKIDPYDPLAAEEYPEGKRIAGRAAERALTYARDASPRQVAAYVGSSVVGERALADAVEPAVEPGMRSAGRVVYAQLSGVTVDSLGAMVVTEQRLQDAKGRWRSLTRVLDVRLVRNGGPWKLEEIASVGGSPVSRPDELSASAERVLDNRNIDLPDSARWDIFRGTVDPALLDEMDAGAKKQKLSVTVLQTGHPPNVWETDQPSAHSSGFAVDIWGVDGTPVIEQREPGSKAYELASSFVSDGATQVGSPWVLGAGGTTSFADEVHQDHLHLQQSSVG